jgi:hypothetical protein
VKPIKVSVASADRIASFSHRFIYAARDEVRVVHTVSKGITVTRKVILFQLILPNFFFQLKITRLSRKLN